MKSVIVVLGALVGIHSFAEVVSGDITAAVRDEGLMPEWSVTVCGTNAPSAYATGETAFNGVWDSNADVFLLPKSAGFPSNPLVIDYALPDAFCAGEKVVVNKIVFRTGHGPAGVGTQWGDCKARQPVQVNVDASNDGVKWTRVHTGSFGEMSYVEEKLANPPAEGKDFAYADSTLTFPNARNFRRYRISVITSGSPANTYPLIFNEVMLFGEYGETIPDFVGDITAKVNEDGLAFTYSATVNGVDVDSDYHTCFNGTWGYFNGSAWSWSQDRLLVPKTTGFPANYPFVVTYDVPQAFCPGQYVVVTAVAFRIGAGPSGPGSFWGDYNTRMPTDVMVEGSDDGANWKPMSRITGSAMSCADYTWTDASRLDLIGKYWYTEKVASFPNWTSCRHYRISVLNTGLPTDANPLQLGEIALLGSVSKKKVRPSMQEGDITAAVRLMGLNTAITSSHAAHSGAGFADVAGLVDGNLSRYGDDNQRFFVDNSPENRANPVVLDLQIPDEFYADGEVVVTGLTFEVGGTVDGNVTPRDPDKRALYGDAAIRMPTAFTIECSTDGAAWRQLHSESDFNSANYETVMHHHPSEGTDSPDYLLKTFSFPNSMSARKYRITLNGSDVITKGLTGNAGMYQMSEVQLHGSFGVSKPGLTIIFF